MFPLSVTTTTRLRGNGARNTTPAAPMAGGASLVTVGPPPTLSLARPRLGFFGVGEGKGKGGATSERLGQSAKLGGGLVHCRGGRYGRLVRATGTSRTLAMTDGPWW